MKEIKDYQNIEEYFQEKDRLKQAMGKMVEETAQELGYNHVQLPIDASGLTSRTIGLHTGPVGGVVVKKLMSMGERQLMEKYGKRD